MGSGGRRTLAVFLLALAALTGCRAGDDGSSRSQDTVVVFAAISLSDAFDDIADRFTAHYPRVEVRLNYAGSQVLAGQLAEGAPADVFASADTVQMARVADHPGVRDPAVFATNVLQLAVEPGNPTGITSLRDLADPDLVVVLPDAQVPAGRAAEQLLEAAGITVRASSYEQDVRATMAKVALGEADAALVYATDVTASGGRVEGIMIAEADEVRSRYPIAVLDDAPRAEDAARFVAFVLSDEGQAVLREHGFGPGGQP